MIDGAQECSVLQVISGDIDGIIHSWPCRDTKQNRDKKHDKLGLQLNLLHCVLDRMGVDEGNLQIIDVDVILKNCPITIPLRYILTSTW